MTFAPNQGDDPPAPPSHRLHRLELEICADEEPLARSVMDRLSRLHHATLDSLLEQVFSELSPPGRWDRLECLELDLGTLQASDLEQQLPKRLEAALRRSLASRLPPPLPPPLQPPVPPKRPQPPSATDPPAAATAPPGTAVDGDGQRRQLELLAVFLATGSLPWWAPRQDRQLIPVALASALALPPPELGALLQQLAGPPGEPSPALQRLLAAASPQQRPRLEQAMQAAQEEALGADLQEEQVAATAPDLPAAPINTPTASDKTPTIKAATEAPADPGPSPPQALASDLDTALALPPPQLGALLQRLTGPPGEPSPALQRLLAAASPRQRPRLEQALKTAQEEALGAALAETVKATEANSKEPTATAQPTPPAAPQPRSDLDDDLVIDGAGMVLLWPFLETLFSRLELLTQERLFGDGAQRQRAMALLGFLVDGDGDPPEWRLTLAKLLCGALPQAPYGLEAPLSDAEQTEAEALVQAVLGHAAGRLGDDGSALRQGFLQRPGMLSARPGAWVLQVERRSGDEVLDGLPWSWSWIRLPWMDDLLQVVW